MEAIIIIAWIALIIALAGAGVVSAGNAWKRIEPDPEPMTHGGNA
jgi:hypothetical protein